MIDKRDLPKLRQAVRSTRPRLQGRNIQPSPIDSYIAREFWAKITGVTEGVYEWQEVTPALDETGDLNWNEADRSDSDGRCLNGDVEAETVVRMYAVYFCGAVYHLFLSPNAEVKIDEDTIVADSDGVISVNVGWGLTKDIHGPGVEANPADFVGESYGLLYSDDEIKAKVGEAMTIDGSGAINLGAFVEPFTPYTVSDKTIWLDAYGRVVNIS
ncbi:MAG: hypothetical protein BIFFINMI_03886 [Phycisphaerae bacterium]|nr:hypothetical protein [Phycisphaerae bacterium]